MDVAAVDEARRLAAARGYDLEIQTLPPPRGAPASAAVQSFELWRDGEFIAPAGRTVADVAAEIDTLSA